MKELSQLSEVKTMSSLEIAELTSKKHGNVVRDIKNTLKQLDDSNLIHQYKQVFDERGYTKFFELDQELTYTVVSGYNVKLRNKVVKRWLELEQGGHQLSLSDSTPLAIAQNLLASIEQETKAHAQTVQRLDQTIKNQQVTLERSYIKSDAQLIYEKMEGGLNIKKPAKKTKRQSPCFLYVLHSEKTRYTKIGISKNPKTRHAAVRTASGRDDLAIMATLKTESVNEAKRIESLLFKVFSDYRQAGEWFVMPKGQRIKLIELINDCQTYANELAIQSTNVDTLS